MLWQISGQSADTSQFSSNLQLGFQLIAQKSRAGMIAQQVNHLLHICEDQASEPPVGVMSYHNSRQVR